MNPFESLTQFKGKDGCEYYFIRPVKNKLLVWQKKDYDLCTCQTLDLSVVNESILTEANLWSVLPAKVQEAIKEAQLKQSEENKEKMAHARKHWKRESKYEGVPNELTCACGYTTPCVKNVFVKKAEKLGVTPQELADGYVCQKCNPTIGKKKKKKT